VSELFRLRLPPHIGQHAEPDTDTARGCTDGLARSETLAGSRLDDGSLSWRTVSARALVGFQGLDVLMAYNPTFVILSSLKSLFFNSLKNES
jgi:hypothetical protein